MINKKGLGLLALCALIISSCGIKNDKENTTKDTAIKEINTAEIQKSISSEFDTINNFTELSNGNLLLTGYKESNQLCKVYEINRDKYIAESNSINLNKVRLIRTITDGFYMINEENITVYNNQLKLKHTIDVPSDAQSIGRNNCCVSNDGLKLYYVKQNNDYSNSLMEINVETKAKRIISTYNGEENNSLALITDMTISEDNSTIFYCGLTYRNKNSQSIESYGTIELKNGIISNTILNLIQLKSSNGYTIIADKEDPENIISPKNYILISNGNDFKKFATKGSVDVGICSKGVFIAHDKVLDKNNVYSQYTTYLYKDNNLVEKIDESKKYKYSNYIVDYYNANYNIYIRSVFNAESEKNNIEVINI